MSPKQGETTRKFQIKSLDSNQPILDSVPAAEGLAADLETIVQKRYPGTTVTIRRAEGIPGARELQELLVHVDWHVVKTAVESAVANFATTEFLKLMKARLRNVFVKPVDSKGSRATDQGAPQRTKRKPGKARANSAGATNKSPSRKKKRKR
jgi:hypothetical protein